MICDFVFLYTKFEIFGKVLLKMYLSSHSAYILFLAFDFIFNNVENPFPHKYVDDNSKSIRMHFFGLFWIL